MKPGITVVGSVNMDLVFRTPRMPVLGETISGREFREIPGGKGANQAVAAARQGGAVFFVGCVGDDGFATRSLASLQQDGIDTSAIRQVANCATGVAGIFVEDQGGNSIVLAAGANAELSIADIDAASSRIAHSKLLICQLETPLATVRHAIALAASQQVAVMLNPAPAQDLDDALLAQVTYLIVNETESAQLSGIAVTDQASAEQAAQKLLQRGVKAVLLTMGEHGVLVADSSGCRAFKGISVEVVDTTAAGDTFVGALAVGLANGLSLDQAAMDAQYAAALTVTQLGAQSSIPSLAQVQAFKQKLAA
ncbi:MAG: ribokinase [Burkholderiales bacterium]|nr:ribokinase [Burkholderiales bacterium]